MHWGCAPSCTFIMKFMAIYVCVCVCAHTYGSLLWFYCSLSFGLTKFSMIPRTGRPNTRKEQFIRSFFFGQSAYASMSLSLSICLCVCQCVCVCFCLWKFALIFIVPLIFGKQHFQSSPQKGSLTEFCLGREHFSWSYFGFLSVYLRVHIHVIVCFFFLCHHI